MIFGLRYMKLRHLLYGILNSSVLSTQYYKVQKMKKGLSVILACIMLMLVFCSCESEQVKQAKEAYAEGKYAEVVELLSQEDNLNDSAQDMLTVSEANVMYENKEYLEAVKKITSSSAGIQNEQYEEMFNAALADAIANKSADNVLELLKIDESKGDAVYEAVTTACNEKDYNGFLVLDGLVEKLEDGDLKTKLATFDEEFDILRAEAFMVGTWERQDEGYDILPKVKVIPYDNNLVGRLIKVGDKQKEYHFQKDDIYWKDFEFESAKRFVCNNLTRYSDGTPEGATASGKINYKKGIIELNVTGTVTPIATWKRVK